MVRSKALSNLERAADLWRHFCQNEDFARCRRGGDRDEQRNMRNLEGSRAFMESRDRAHTKGKRHSVG